MRSDIKILSVYPYYFDETCRTPLKFGNVVVEQLPYCQVKVEVENRTGRRAEGWGGIFLMDFWAFPDSAVPHPLRQQAMIQIVERLAKVVEGYGRYAHPVDLFFDLEPDLLRLGADVSTELGLAVPMPALAALVCASPIDAAIHDAFGNANDISTYDGYGPECMSHDLSRYLGTEFRGRCIADRLRPSYVPRVPVFHLVGGLDKLRRSEVDDTDPQDGLPNSLDEWIERDGLFCLKVKLRGTDLPWDVDRIIEVVRIAHEAQEKQGTSELYFSADTNEQCKHPEYVIELLHQLRERDPRAFDELLYVEQPTERDLTAHRFDMRPLAKIKPVIVDESLTSLEDFNVAMELGWSGVALKSCKCPSAALVFAAKAEHLNIPYTIQDLTNPALALIHSVGLAARLHPMKGVEANSRQFFPRASEPEAAVHPGIFHVRDGMVSTESLQGYGLGYQIEKINRV